MELITVTTTHGFTAKQICDLFTTAFEGGSNFWVRQANALSPVPDDGSGVVWWGRPSFWDTDFKFEIVHDDPYGDYEDESTTTVIDRAAVLAGLQKLAASF